ncbi:MAG: hypothetical protein WD749_04975 [Phycisphaerales bacterium]
MSPLAPRVRRALLLAIAGAALLGLAYKPAIHANLFPKNFGEVDPGKVYRAGQLSPAQFRAIHERHGIRTIIDLGSFEPGDPGEARNQRTADALGIPRYVFDLEGDATGNPNWYVHTLRIMTDPAKQPVLVHCGAGSERTSCAVILYDALIHNAPIDEGYAAASRFKHDPARNPHLKGVLDRHAQDILNAVTDRTQVRDADPIPDPAPAKPLQR